MQVRFLSLVLTKKGRKIMEKKVLFVVGATVSAIAVPTYITVRKLIERRKKAITTKNELNQLPQAISKRELEYHNVRIDVSDISADFNGSLYAKLHDVVKDMYIPMLKPDIVLGKIRGVDSLSLRISFPNIVITEDDKTYQLS